MQGIPDEWVTETSVSGLQVAVALGTKRADLDNSKCDRFAITRRQGVFLLSVHNIALITKNYENLKWFLGPDFLNMDPLDMLVNDYVFFCHQPKWRSK